MYTSVADVDLLVGCLAEEPRPRGFAFGETAFTIFVQQASRRLMTDRFFQEDFAADVYSQTGVDWVNNATFTGVSPSFLSENIKSLDFRKISRVLADWDLLGQQRSLHGREYPIHH